MTKMLLQSVTKCNQAHHSLFPNFAFHMQLQSGAAERYQRINATSVNIQLTAA